MIIDTDKYRYMQAGKVKPQKATTIAGETTAKTNSVPPLAPLACSALKEMERKWRNLATEYVAHAALAGTESWRIRWLAKAEACKDCADDVRAILKAQN